MAERGEWEYARPFTDTGAARHDNMRNKLYPLAELDQGTDMT